MHQGDDYNPNDPRTDRRHERAIPMHVLTHVAEVVDAFRRDENERHKRLDEEINGRFSEIGERFDALDRRIHNLTDSITAFMGKTEVLFDAFPASDPQGHRRAHEMWLEESRAKKELYQTLKKELAKYGLLGLASWVFFNLWQAFLQGPK